AVNINFHAASGGAAAGRNSLLRQSHAFNCWLIETVERLNADVMITTEHQLPPKSDSTYFRIGDNFPELIEMVAYVDHDRFASCWDMGHSMMRVARYDIETNPPDKYLPLVKHVHIHDVDMTAESDHRPIGTADSPLSIFVALLLDVGYAGAFTMEYQASEFFRGDYVDFLRRSKNALLQLAGVNTI
ncbi:MAG TPA: TIM barrel protein, partial [Aggregatilineales bacterium]|nr:TIM barrel protein [Aggregatilineales bacterium]